ncbi:MAG: hypothetical protein ABEI32_14130 [Halothece sp.]
MATNNKHVACYLPPEIEQQVTDYAQEYGITRKDGQARLGSAIVEILREYFTDKSVTGSDDQYTAEYNTGLESNKNGGYDGYATKYGTGYNTEGENTKKQDELENRIQRLEAYLPQQNMDDVLSSLWDEISHLKRDKLTRSDFEGWSHPIIDVASGDETSKESSPKQNGRCNGATLSNQNTSNGLSYRELAKKLEIDRSYLTKWQEGAVPGEKSSQKTKKAYEKWKKWYLGNDKRWYPSKVLHKP